MYMVAFALALRSHEHGKILVYIGNILYFCIASFCKVRKWFEKMVNDSVTEFHMIFLVQYSILFQQEWKCAFVIFMMADRGPVCFII